MLFNISAVCGNPFVLLWVAGRKFSVILSILFGALMLLNDTPEGGLVVHQKEASGSTHQMTHKKWARN